jgi:transcriptional regulator with XRE-family HTH domain
MGSSAIHGKRYQAFLKRLRQAREESGMTQRDVAKALGRLQSFVEKCEQGGRRVDAAELFEFAAVYEKPVEFFDPGDKGR